MLFEDFEPNRIKALNKFRWRILILCTGRSWVYGITNEVDFTTRLTKVQLRDVFFSTHFYLDDFRILAKISLLLLLFNFLFLLINLLDYFLSLRFVNWNTNDCHSVFSFSAAKNSVTRDWDIRYYAFVKSWEIFDESEGCLIELDQRKCSSTGDS